MKFYCWLLLLGTLWSGSLPAQPFVSRNLSIQHGLPEYFVSGILQDKAGLIWIATRDGLARYDGRQFKVFRRLSHGNHALANNIIRSIQPVSDTAMLLQLEDASLQVFNPVTEKFGEVIVVKQQGQSAVKLDNPTLSADEKLVWGYNETQISCFDRQTKLIKTYPVPTSEDAGPYLENTHLPYERQLLYAALSDRLIQFDKRKGKCRSWKHRLIGVPGIIETYYGVPTLRRSSGEILISAAHQLLLFDPKTQHFRTIFIPSTIDTRVGLIYEAWDGQVYFTYGMTVYRLSHNDKVTAIWEAPRIDYQNYFQALMVDRSGVLWIGTNGDGIEQIDLQALPIKTHPYRVNFVHDVLSEELRLTVPTWARTDKFIYQLRLDGNAPYMSVGITSWFELLRGEPNEGKFQSILKRKRKGTQEEFDGGNALRVQSDGTIWMYDAHHGIIKADSTGKLLEKFDCPISINWVSSIQPLGQTIWIGSEESGLYAYDILSRKIVQHLKYQPSANLTLPSDHVQCMVADPSNSAILWIGTKEGLSELNTRTMHCQNWSEEQGLPSGTINTLLVDKQGNLWFSTGKGITRMNPKTKKMRHFFTYDGLLDIEYRHNHALNLPDGRMAFGGAKGITVFDPLALTDSAQSIPVVLTGFRLANMPIEPGKIGSPLSLPINATETLLLQPHQNFFSIEYAGMQYNKPASLRYRYQLEGVDANWVEAGSQTLANYTQVGPGDYRFRVNAANADGRWSPLIKTIRIIIDPPWWRTWWFYLLATLLFLSSIYGLYRYRLAQVLKLQNLRNNIARDLHDDVGASLSSIAIYSSIVLDQQGTSTFKSEPLLVKITEQANEIMGAMNDIVWSINTRNDAFEMVFSRMREHALQLLEAKGYTLHFDFDENLHRTKLVMEKRRDFYLIYKEALNNIAKYAEARNVWISVAVHNSTIELLIRDDGQGFDVSAVSGNGISNMKHRATILRGILRIVSEPGKGTTVHLSF